MWVVNLVCWVVMIPVMCYRHNIDGALASLGAAINSFAMLMMLLKEKEEKE